MKIVQMSFSVTSKNRNQMIDITSQVKSVLDESNIKDGDIIIYCPHTTAGITINENADRDVQHDILLTLSTIFPSNISGYRHSEGNSDSHVKSSLVGCSEQVIVKNKSMCLGTWQGIYFCEFDGPRTRRVEVQIRGLD